MPDGTTQCAFLAAEPTIRGAATMWIEVWTFNSLLLLTYYLLFQDKHSQTNMKPCKTFALRGTPA